MDLVILILGLVVLLGGHVFVACRGLRAGAIERVGELAYKVLFSLVSVVGLALVVWGFSLYRADGAIPLWYPPPWTRHVTVALMLPATILIAASYVRGRIYAAVKHPMLAGIKLWALAHLVANGDLGGIVLFGAFLLWVAADRISLKFRTDAGAPPIPVGSWRSDMLAAVVGTLVYLALGFVFHPLAIGIPVFVR